MTEGGSSRLDREGANRDETRGATDLFGELWAQALVTAEAAEEEVRRLVERLAEVADLRPTDLQSFRAALASRLSLQRKELERSLEESVRQALQRIQLPSRAQVAALRQRVIALSSRLDRVETHRPSPEPVEKV